MRWWTSDHHFGHANIIKYCNRPFADTDEMNKAVDRQLQRARPHLPPAAANATAPKRRAIDPET